MLKKLGYIFSKKDKVTIAFLLVAVIIGSFFELMGVTIFMPFIEIIMDPDVIMENVALHWAYELGGFQSTTGFLTAISAAIIFIYIFKNLFMVWEKNAIYKFSYRTQRSISTRLLKAYMNEPYTFHLNKNIAVLQRSMQEDTDLFTKGIIHAMEMLAEVVVCIAIGLYLFKVSMSITAVVVGLLVVCVGMFTVISKRYSRKLGQQSQKYKGTLYQWMNQSLGGIKEIKVLNREDYFIQSYDSYFQKYVHGLRMNRLIGVIPKHVVEAVSMTGLLIAIIIKMYFGQKELIEFVPQLSVFAVAAFRLLPSVGKINEHMSATLYSAPSLDLIYHDLKEVEDMMVDRAVGHGNAETVATESGVISVNDKKNENPVDKSWKLKERIKVQQLSYHYPDSEVNVIEKANFVIPKGKTIAFIGSSGAGKTTMVDILLGLLKPQYGKIFADDMDIDKNMSTWQKEIGYIPQVIYLSDDTIRNNIAFGVPADQIDEEAVMEALKKAQLYEFVENLPEGLETYVGDRGVRLSGGQRQRIGIARALYHDPEILVLDEATSALDNETEAAVMESIENLHGTKTMIIIAHRLSTIRNVDTIYEVTGGQVVERSKEEVFD